MWFAVTENLNTKINAEVEEFLGVGTAVISDLRDCGYLSKSTRCFDLWISRKTFKILNTIIHKVDLIL